MTIGNRFAKLLIDIVYLAIPCLLFYTPFYDGDYSYYISLRKVVFLFCGYFTFLTFMYEDGYFANRNSKYPYFFLVITILYNPIIMIHLDKDIWTPINIITGIFLLFYFIERKIYHKTHKV